jgi:hypothetical protein
MGVLKHEADLVQAQIGEPSHAEFLDLNPFHRSASGAWLRESREKTQGCRLAAAPRPYVADRFAEIGFQATSRTSISALIRHPHPNWIWTRIRTAEDLV